MNGWRNGLRPIKGRRLWGKFTLIGLSVLMLVLTSCGGGALRHESWSGLIVHESTVYAANLEQVQAFNAETGKLYWSYPQKADKAIGPFYSTPAIVPDFAEHGLLIVSGFNDRKIHALRLGASPAEVPDLAWTFPSEGAANGGGVANGNGNGNSGAAGQYVGDGVVVDDMFLIGNGDGKVYALNLADGSLAWSQPFETNGRVWATPVVQDDVVYIASLDHHLYAVDLATGNELWQIELEGSIASTPVFANDVLWVGDFAKKLYRIDPETQAIDDVLTTEGWIWATPVVDNNVLYLTDISGHVYAFNMDSQTMVWANPAIIEDIVHSQPVLSATGDKLYLAGYEHGGIWTINTESGAVSQWQSTDQNPGRLPSDLVTDGERLYVMPAWVPERVQVFDMDGGSLWTYPSDK